MAALDTSTGRQGLFPNLEFPNFGQATNAKITNCAAEPGRLVAEVSVANSGEQTHDYLVTVDFSGPAGRYMGPPKRRSKVPNPEL